METDPYHTPALRPPDDVEPMFRDYYPIRGSQIAVATVLLTLSTCGVLARTYTRACILKKFDLSDLSLILALVLYAAFTALKLVANTYGQGHHQWDVNLVTIKHFLFTQNLVEAIYCPPMLFAKYTILRQIEVIFYEHQHRRVAARVIWGLIWANVVFYTAIFFVFLFACVPRAKIADPSLDGRCIDTHATILATSVVNVVSDATILVIPLAAVFRLQLRPRAKLGVAFFFAVGIFANVACIVRLYYGVELTRSEDGTWFIEGVGTWAMVEFATVILVACFPLFPRFYHHLTNRGKRAPFQLVDYHQDGKRGSSHPAQLRTPEYDVGDGSSTKQLCQP